MPSTIQKNTDYLGEARNRQLAQYKLQPRMDAILQAWMRECQAVEDSSYTFFVDRELQFIINPANFPITIRITTPGTLGTMQFTVQLGSGPVSPPFLSQAISGGYPFIIPGTVFTVLLGAINYAANTWVYTIDRFGAIVPTGGAGAGEILIEHSDLLAKLGNLVGQTNLGLPDPQFVYLIQARIRTNRSNGNLTDLVSITQLLDRNLTDPVSVHTLPPATVVVSPLGPPAVDPYVVERQFLAEGVAAGVSLAYVWSIAPQATSIVCGSVYAPGFAVVADVPQGTGILPGQAPGSIYYPGFNPGPPPSGDLGGVLFGAVQNVGE